jgi:hypothetical protein
MAFPNDLLEQALHLANREPKRPKQASLRRAVSTAYYALFHLLSIETAKNWKRKDERQTVARMLGHKPMSDACDRKRRNWTNISKRSPLLATCFMFASIFTSSPRRLLTCANIVKPPTTT